MDCIFKSSMFSNFFLRLLTALVAIPVVIVITYQGPPYFDVLMFITLGGLLREWNRFVLPTASAKELLLKISGYFYIIISVGALIAIAHRGKAHIHLILWIFLLIWATDTGAYIFGRCLKGPKLAPRISPNKTWAGFFGGLITATALGIFALTYTPPLPLNLSPLTAIFLFSVGAQMGDLIESAVKRFYGVKDSGSFVPGHGGLLDRLDSLLFVSILLALLYGFGYIQS